VSPCYLFVQSLSLFVVWTLTTGANANGGSAAGSGSAACDWTDDATAGAGATALSAWRSVARRARAVVRLAVGKYVRIHRSTYQTKPFHLSSETVPPIK
jgi:hypothetical protein